METDTETEAGKEVLPGEDKGILNRNDSGLKDKRPWLKANHFKSGESGNPKGRPKGSKTGIRARLKRLLETEGKQAVIDKLEKEGGKILEDRSASNVIASVLVDKSQDGCKDSIRIVLDQTEAALPRNVKVDATLEITKIERLILDNPEVIEIES